MIIKYTERVRCYYMKNHHFYIEYKENIRRIICRWVSRIYMCLPYEQYRCLLAYLLISP